MRELSRVRGLRQHKKNHLVHRYEVTVWGGRTYKIRTCDQRIKSPLLYQLS